MIRTPNIIKYVLSGLLLLPGLTAFSQSGADDGDLGSDPGLPAEAPHAPGPAPRAPKASQGSTLPAPPPESLVTPYESPAQPAMPMPQSSAPSVKKAPPITGKLAELNLSAEQIQQIGDLRRQWKPEVEKRLKEEFLFLKQNLAQAMADNSPGEEVRRRFEAMQKKYLELQTLKFEKLLRIREVLTPEQRRKFAELRSRPAVKGNNNDD